MTKRNYGWFAASILFFLIHAVFLIGRTSEIHAATPLPVITGDILDQQNQRVEGAR